MGTNPSNGDFVGVGAVEVTARVERVWLGIGATDVVPGGAFGGAAAVTWWATENLSFSANAYVLRFDTPPDADASHDLSVTGLVRATFSLR
jgi:phosphate-selective porin OprO/OprP